MYLTQKMKFNYTFVLKEKREGAGKQLVEQNIHISNYHEHIFSFQAETFQYLSGPWVVHISKPSFWSIFWDEPRQIRPLSEGRSQDYTSIVSKTDAA